VAARRLSSGDVLVTFQGHQEKEKWESQREILGAFGEGARTKTREYTGTKTREYTVLAHGIRVEAINPSNQAVAGMHMARRDTRHG
jgi:hypothetical protein